MTSIQKKNKELILEFFELKFPTKSKEEIREYLIHHIIPLMKMQKFMSHNPYSDIELFEIPENLIYWDVGVEKFIKKIH